MASLREEARWVLDVARDGIGWIIVYKTGRSWHCLDIYPDVLNEAGDMAFEEDDLAQIRNNILTVDPNAILVNSDWCNLGDTETMTLQSLCDALRWQYELGHQLLSDKLPQEDTEPEEPADD